MAVPSLAREVSPTTAELPPDSSVDTNGQSPDRPDRIDIADRLSTAIDEFLTGLTGGAKRISVDWVSLSPIFSVIRDIAPFAFIAARWL
jgi:hypothetical protein